MAHSTATSPRWSGLARLGVMGSVMIGASVFAAAANPRTPSAPTPAPASHPSAAAAGRMDIGRAMSDTDHLAVNAVVYQGWKMFEVYCTRCHGEDAVGTSFAPALRTSVGPSGTIDHVAFFQTVTQGRPAKGMPTWGNLLSPEQKEDIWNYLRARAVGGLVPGRPHLKPGSNRDSTVLSPALGKDTTWTGPTS
jgi:mono/diheme cytochrome c family protein